MRISLVPAPPIHSLFNWHSWHTFSEAWKNTTRGKGRPLSVRLRQNGDNGPTFERKRSLILGPPHSSAPRPHSRTPSAGLSPFSPSRDRVFERLNRSIAIEFACFLSHTCLPLKVYSRSIFPISSSFRCFLISYTRIELHGVFRVCCDRSLE